jgi:hypothetical protein
MLASRTAGAPGPRPSPLAAAPPSLMAGSPRRPAQVLPQRVTLVVLLTALVAAALVVPVARGQPASWIWNMQGSYDSDPLWNDLFGSGYDVWQPDNTTSWRENVHWAAPGVGPQLQWWNSRTRECTASGLGGSSLDYAGACGRWAVGSSRGDGHCLRAQCGPSHFQA